MRKKDGTAEELPVVVGMNDGDKIEVESGVNEGDTVLLPEGAKGRWRKDGDDGQTKTRSDSMRTRTMRVPAR
jgi:hypothetical protein